MKAWRCMWSLVFAFLWFCMHLNIHDVFKSLVVYHLPVAWPFISHNATPLSAMVYSRVSRCICHFPSWCKSTGVTACDSVITSFSDFKLKKGDYNVRYFIYYIKNKKLIEIEKTGRENSTYEDFVNDLPENECRYGLIDLDFETKDGRLTSKMVFISWNPDTAPSTSKFIYSGSKEVIKSALAGVGIHINATDYSELDFEEAILPVVRRFA